MKIRPHYNIGDENAFQTTEMEFEKHFYKTTCRRPPFLLPILKYCKGYFTVYSLLTPVRHRNAQKQGADATIKLCCFSDLRGRYEIANQTLFYKGPFPFEIRSATDRVIEVIRDQILSFRPKK